MASGWGLVLASSREVNCSFSNNDGTVVAHYTGHIDKIGVDVGYHAAGVLIWGVIAPTNGREAGLAERDLRRRHRERDGWRWRRRQLAGGWI